MANKKMRQTSKTLSVLVITLIYFTGYAHSQQPCSLVVITRCAGVMLTFSSQPPTIDMLDQACSDAGNFQNCIEKVCPNVDPRIMSTILGQKEAIEYLCNYNRTALVSHMNCWQQTNVFNELKSCNNEYVAYMTSVKRDPNDAYYGICEASNELIFTCAKNALRVCGPEATEVFTNHTIIYLQPVINLINCTLKGIGWTVGTDLLCSRPGVARCTSILNTTIAEKFPSVVYENKICSRFQNYSNCLRKECPNMVGKEALTTNVLQQEAFDIRCKNKTAWANHQMCWIKTDVQNKKRTCQQQYYVTVLQIKANRSLVNHNASICAAKSHMIFKCFKDAIKECGTEAAERYVNYTAKYEQAFSRQCTLRDPLSSPPVSSSTVVSSSLVSSVPPTDQTTYSVDETSTNSSAPSIVLCSPSSLMVMTSAIGTVFLSIPQRV